MTQASSRPPIAPGDVAPNFSLPTVGDAGEVSLRDYRGRSSVLLALFIGLWCPFCRRAIAQISAAAPKLKAVGVEALGVVATPRENAELYFKYRPCAIRLASDPHLSTHLAYGVPKPPATPELMDALSQVKINPTGELPSPLPIPEAAAALSKLDGYQENDTDRADLERQWSQLKGQFMIDRDGVVRWVYIECAEEGLAGLGKLPSIDDLLQAARSSLPR